MAKHTEPPIGSNWRHLKRGSIYTVRENGLWEPTQGPCVIYKAHSDGTVWVRFLNEFMDGRYERIGEKPTPGFTVGTVLIYVGDLKTAEGHSLQGERALIVEESKSRVIKVKFSNPDTGRYHHHTHWFYPQEFVIDPTLRS